VVLDAVVVGELDGLVVEAMHSLVDQLRMLLVATVHVELVLRRPVQPASVHDAIPVTDRESGLREFLKKIKFMKTTGFLKCPLKFILKFSTLILTEKLQSHFFAVTETLNGDKSDSSQCYSEFY